MVTIAKVPVKMTTPRREEEEIKNLRGSGNRRRKKGPYVSSAFRATRWWKESLYGMTNGKKR